MAAPGTAAPPISLLTGGTRGDAPQWAERVIAGLCAVASAPVLIPVLVTARLLSGRSPLVAHERIGKDGEPFWMLKVRTMWDGCPHHGSPELIERIRTRGLPDLKSDVDPRVTSTFAAFCRRYSIDELPQLLHVITGRMSLVGPRPLTRAELDAYYGPAATEVVSVRPGLSGLWQITGRSRLTYHQRKRLDLFLVRKRCFGLYCSVLLRTPLKVLTGQDAV